MTILFSASYTDFLIRSGVKFAMKIYSQRRRGTNHVTHVGLKLKLHGWAEDTVTHFHQTLLVTVGIQIFHGILNGIQAFML